MYKKNLVAIIKVNNKILREDDDTVYLPFGSEYTLAFKNMDSRRVVVRVSIDGEDILDGGRLSIDGNSEIELERYVDSPNKFKFIQKTDNIKKHRGDRIDDGFVRIEYQFEEKVFPSFITRPAIYDTPLSEPWGKINTGTPIWKQEDNIFYTNATTTTTSGSMTTSSYTSRDGENESSYTTTYNTSGITVPGSHSDQEFIETTVRRLEDEKHVMVLQMRGTIEETKTPVSKPVTTRTKVTCPICGRRQSSTHNFCSECSAALKKA